MSRQLYDTDDRARWSLWSAVRLKLAGAALVVTLAAIVVVALSMFAGRYATTVAVTVDAPRAGLVLDPDAKVTLRGVEIGRVSAVRRTTDRVWLTLALDPEALRFVPANVRVDIRSTTVFGAKYVNFVVPQMPSAEPLRPGATVRADAVTVEFNTLFEHLTRVLAQIAPERLNATLSALGAALRGRGAELGDLLARADAYLRDLNPSLPALHRDTIATAQVTSLYADTVDDLLRTAADLTTTSTTIADRADELDALLLNVIGLADTTTAVLTENERPVDAALALLRPTTTLVDAYKPVLNCVVLGLAQTLPAAESFVGGVQPGAVFNAGFMYGGEPYTYPDDLPKVNATGGPHCEGILDRTPGTHSPYLVTDTAEHTPYIPSTTLTLNPPKVFQVLFAGLPGITPP
ncbi:MCE family protein [Nocardia tenerifensis]|uniref:MCE family protein n=1 Tax=Nocardia tenerifensis TaxID=228006 RepID=UPI00030FBFE7|nr:MCE family protein [Nocardia tenerifensis]